MLHLVSKKQEKKIGDSIVFFFALTTPLFEIPQAVEIYQNHSAKNVSTLTWVYFLLDNIVWLVYGFKRKSKPIILTYSLYTVVELIVVSGIIAYH
jgi:uncharacterized protein with PQ loop repeat